MFFGPARHDWVFKPESAKKAFTAPPKSIARGAGEGPELGQGASAEWLNAIKTGTPTHSHFGASAPSSETVHPGHLFALGEAHSIGCKKPPGDECAGVGGDGAALISASLGTRLGCSPKSDK